MLILNFGFEIETTSALLVLTKISHQTQSQSLIITAFVKKGLLSYQDDLTIENKNFNIKKLQINSEDVIAASIGDSVEIEIDIDPMFLEKFQEYINSKNKEMQELIEDLSSGL